jgi:hypothetical protein
LKDRRLKDRHFEVEGQALRVEGLKDRVEGQALRGAAVMTLGLKDRHFAAQLS